MAPNGLRPGDRLGSAGRAGRMRPVPTVGRRGPAPGTIPVTRDPVTTPASAELPTGVLAVVSAVRCWRPRRPRSSSATMATASAGRPAGPVRAPSGPDGPRATAGAEATSHRRPAPTVAALPRPRRGRHASPPVRVSIPAIGDHSSLQALGLLRTGACSRLANGSRPAGTTAAMVPGSTGPAVIAGHVDSVSGPAVFFRLRELRVGDQVRVTRRTTTGSSRSSWTR